MKSVAELRQGFTEPQYHHDFIREIIVSVSRRSTPYSRLNLLERSSRMAALALLAESALVNILAVVAPHATGRCQHLVAIHRQLVAVQALGLLVRAVDLVLGTLVVIEVPGFPVACVVAGVALLAQPQLVLVFLLVAGIAV